MKKEPAQILEQEWNDITGKVLKRRIHGKLLDDDEYAHDYYDEWLAEKESEYDKSLTCRICGEHSAINFDDIIDIKAAKRGIKIITGKSDICDDCRYRIRYCIAGKNERRESYRILRESAVVKLGGKCTMCGCTDRRILQIDHVDGNGAEDRRKYRRGVNGSKDYLEHIINNPQGYQLLCANHNWLKRVENHEWVSRSIDDA